VSEEAYPKDHPAHPDNAGKHLRNPVPTTSEDYPPEHPARGGQGQLIPTEAGSHAPRDGFKHLKATRGATLREAEKGARQKGE